MRTNHLVAILAVVFACTWLLGCSPASNAAASAEETTYVAFQTEVKSGNVISVHFKAGRAIAKYVKPISGSTSTTYAFDYVAEDDKYHEDLLEMLQSYRVTYSISD